MSVGVIDAGVAIGWFRGQHRSLGRLVKLFESSKRAKATLVLSTVNLAEVLRHTEEQARVSGVDILSLLRSYRVEIHRPDEAIAYRVSRLRTSLADGFAAATAAELRARLHTTDAELVRQLRGSGMPISEY